MNSTQQVTPAVASERMSATEDGLDGQTVRQLRHVLGEVEQTCVLFTDLVGSTRLWETDPDRMASALARHDDIVEETIDAHGGSIFKWTGDGCCARFHPMGDAPAAALALLRAVRAERWETDEPLHLRIALHAGPARRHRGGDLVGATLNHTARLLELCGSDHAIATAEAVRTLGYRRGRAEVWRSRGWTTLRDVGRPFEIFEATEPS